MHADNVFTMHVDMFTFEHAVHNVHMQVQNQTSGHILHDTVHIVILAFKSTKTLFIFMGTHLQQNLAMIIHITCSFCSIIVLKLQKN